LVSPGDRQAVSSLQREKRTPTSLATDLFTKNLTRHVPSYNARIKHETSQTVQTGFKMMATEL
jgi:hypothetical protein